MQYVIHENTVLAIEMYLKLESLHLTKDLRKFRELGGWTVLTETNPKLLTCTLPMPDYLEVFVFGDLRRLSRQIFNNEKYVLNTSAREAYIAWADFIGVEPSILPRMD